MFQSTVGTYLEDFLERIRPVPNRIKRELKLMADLDQVQYIDHVTHRGHVLTQLFTLCATYVHIRTLVSTRQDSEQVIAEIKALQAAYISKARRRIRDKVREPTHSQSLARADHERHPKEPALCHGCNAMNGLVLPRPFVLLYLFCSPVACQAGRGGNLAEIAEDKSALEEIKKKRDVAVQKADEKVNITTMLYNILDHHIRKLGMTRISTHSAQNGTQRQALPCPAWRSQHTALCANHTPRCTDVDLQNFERTLRATGDFDVRSVATAEAAHAAAAGAGGGAGAGSGKVSGVCAQPVVCAGIQRLTNEVSALSPWTQAGKDRGRKRASAAAATHVCRVTAWWPTAKTTHCCVSLRLPFLA